VAVCGLFVSLINRLEPEPPESKAENGTE